MDADLFRRARRAPSLRWRLLTLVSIAAVVILGLSASLNAPIEPAKFGVFRM